MILKLVFPPLSTLFLQIWGAIWLYSAKILATYPSKLFIFNIHFQSVSKKQRKQDKTFPNMTPWSTNNQELTKQKASYRETKKSYERRRNNLRIDNDNISMEEWKKTKQLIS